MLLPFNMAYLDTTQGPVPGINVHSNRPRVIPDWTLANFFIQTKPTFLLMLPCTVLYGCKVVLSSTALFFLTD